MDDISIIFNRLHLNPLIQKVEYQMMLKFQNGLSFRRMRMGTVKSLLA